jgi:molybdenum cofactor cytidylyltransferase
MRGAPMLLRACRMAGTVADDAVVVVLGAGALRLRCLLRRRRCDVVVVQNAAWRTGMAGSLRAGLARVPRRTDGLLICLVDQVGIGANDLARLAGAWRNRPRRPAAAFYEGRAAVPAVIPRRLFGRLRELTGDTGARQLLGNAGDLSLVAMPSAAFDMDTPEDVALVLRKTAVGVR